MEKLCIELKEEVEIIPISKSDLPRAIFDSTERYRYWWARQWNKDLPIANFVMLNPSTADAKRSDPTVTRCHRYVERWGFGSLIVTNIFAYRSTDPKQLRLVDDPIGEETDDYIIRAADLSDLIVVAWGVHGDHLGRGHDVLSLLCDRHLFALGTTKSGSPRHPLYLASNLLPNAYNVE